jgi:streptogramin lyase
MHSSTHRSTARRGVLRGRLRPIAQVAALGVLASQAGLLFAASPAAAATATATIHEYRPNGIMATSTSDPLGITKGPDGNLWFTDAGASRIGKISTSGTGFAEYATGTPNATPVAITSAASQLWFTELSGSVNQVARSTTSGSQNAFSIASPGAMPSSIVTGPDGNLWFTDFGNGTIGTISPSAPAGTVAKTYALTNSSLNPMSITSGPNGHLWYTEQGSGGGKIGEMTTAGVQVSDTQAASASGAGIDGITVGPDGNLWFTEQNGGRIGKMTPNHVVTEFPPLPGSGSPTAITAGSDGALWFIDQGNNAIGRITTSGVVTEYAVPTAGAFSPNVQPTGIASGPDGNIWFTEQDTKAAIGVLVVSSISGSGGTTGGGGGSGCTGLAGLLNAILAILGLGHPC